MILYAVSMPDDESYAFHKYPHLTDNQRVYQEVIPDFSGESTQARRCEACGQLLDKWLEPPAELVVKKRKSDISITYDGIVVTSQKFKSIYEINNLIGLEFRRLPSDPSFFMIHSNKTVSFDAERRKTRFIDLCSLCGHFESVIGATPIYLQVGTEVCPQEFVRTDLEFGSGDEKHPIIICGDVSANALLDAKLKGLSLKRITFDSDG